MVKMAHTILLGTMTGAALGTVVVAAMPAFERKVEPPVRVALAVARPDPAASAAAPEPEPAGYVVKRALQIDEPIVHGVWKWDESNVPAGPGRIVITVDTVAQTMAVFRDGYQIGMAVVLYGAGYHPTPAGIYPITQKREHHVSNIYGSPMPFMQRLTNDGISIHASDVREGYATHGCIGVPAPFAKKLFETTKLGDVVIITHGEMLQVGQEIAAAG